MSPTSKARGTSGKGRRYIPVCSRISMKEICKFLYLEYRNNEDVYHSYCYNIVKAFGKSFREIVVTIYCVIFSWFFKIDLSFFACSCYLIIE